MLDPRAPAPLLLSVLALACQPAPSAEPRDAAPPPASTPPSTTPPLTGEWLTRLPVPGFEVSFVSVPLGAAAPRPIMIGVHGMRDRPEWACGEWRGVTDAYPFILCPHGQPIAGAAIAGLTFTNAAIAGQEIEAGIAALRARFGSYVAEGPYVYAGFSRGAIVGVPILVTHPDLFPRAVLGEGGQSAWTEDAAKRYAAGGGKRVLFVCTTRICVEDTRPVMARLEKAGVATRMVSAGDIGHRFDGRVVEVIRPAWPWVVEGEPRFAR
jgi:predicted esterase